MPEKPESGRVTVLVCVNRRLSHASASCAGRGSLALAESLRRCMAARCPGVQVRDIHCFGRCNEGPNVRIAPGGPFYRGVTESDLDSIVQGVRVFLARRS